MQLRGNSVIDYIICEQNLYWQVNFFKTWEEEFSIVSDHRFLTIEVEGRLEKHILEKGEGLRGWRREIRDRSNLKNFVRRRGARCENFGMPEWVGSEQAWKSWIETHDRIARR